MFLNSESPCQQVLENLPPIVASDINVYILGATVSVRKSLPAISTSSQWACSKNHFIPVNCQVFAEAYSESELFGHGKWCIYRC